VKRLNKTKNIIVHAEKSEFLRINKFLGESGFCSRREADALIEQGRVMVNNEKAVQGMKISPKDEIRIDGKIITSKRTLVYIAFNKPVGITSTTEHRVEGNIVDFIRHPVRIFPIGRLDKDSEGLIFLTNDGDIVNKILRAGNNHEKEYIVTVDKVITPEFIRGMSSGVRILGTMTKECWVKQEGKNVFRIILTQGLNRQIRRMCEVFGYRVIKLKRVRIMNVKLGNLPIGKWRNLAEEELTEINRLISGSIKTKEGSITIDND
jgi:23S rRNA pseudouridine2604 synthase